MFVIVKHITKKYHEVRTRVDRSKEHTSPAVLKSLTSMVLRLFVLMSDQSMLNIAILHTTESAQHRNDWGDVSSACV